MKTYTFEDILAYFLGQMDERKKALFEANGPSLLYVSAALEGLKQLEKRFDSKTEMLDALHRYCEAERQCLFAGFPRTATNRRARSDLRESESIE